VRCIGCYEWSWRFICPHCAKTLFQPTITMRKIGSLEVYSFYKYQHIAKYIKSKYSLIGYPTYRAFAQLTTKPFIQNFIQGLDKPIAIIGVDEEIRQGYSNVAILSHSMKTPLSIPLHRQLIAQTKVNYAGKSLDYRLSNPRNFLYRGKGGVDAILIDDTITTGATLHEAYLTLKKHNVNVLFALTLSDAKEE